MLRTASNCLFRPESAQRRTVLLNRCCYHYGTTTTTTTAAANTTRVVAQLPLTMTRNIIMKPTIALNRYSNKLTNPFAMQQKRMMGGDSHLPKPQSEDAVLFGGHSTQPEGWETTIHIGYSISLVLCIFILFFEPETGIDAWANQEARARLKLKEEHGWTNDMFQFGVHYQNLNDEEVKEQWDKFSNKTVNMSEDDDDDDDEEE